MNNAEPQPPDPTRKLWEEKYGRPLTEEELREARANLTGFFRLLMEWQMKADAAASGSQ